MASAPATGPPKSFNSIPEGGAPASGLTKTLGGHAGMFASGNAARRPTSGRGRTNGLRLAGVWKITGTTVRLHPASTCGMGTRASVMAAQMLKACRQALASSADADHSPPVRIPQENIREPGSKSLRREPTQCLSSSPHQSLRQAPNSLFPGPKIGAQVGCPVPPESRSHGLFFSACRRGAGRLQSVLNDFFNAMNVDQLHIADLFRFQVFLHVDFVFRR